MEWFAVVCHTSLSENQRRYLERVLADVTGEFLAELADGHFCRWIDDQMRPLS